MGFLKFWLIMGTLGIITFGGMAIKLGTYLITKWITT